MKELPTVAHRLCSPYYAEAHCSDKRSATWAGYKVHLTETCDEDGVHLFVHAETYHSMIPDEASTAGIHHKLAQKQLLPAEHVIDACYNRCCLAGLECPAVRDSPDRSGAEQCQLTSQSQPRIRPDTLSDSLGQQVVICPQGSEVQSQ